MRFMFIQIKKELGITSNKEALREILKQKTNPQKVQKIPGEKEARKFQNASAFCLFTMAHNVRHIRCLPAV